MLVTTRYLQCCINVEAWLFFHDICKTCILVWGCAASVAVTLLIPIGDRCKIVHGIAVFIETALLADFVKKSRVR